MKVLNKENSKNIVKNVLSMREELRVEETDKQEDKINLIVSNYTNSSCKYGICIRFRNFPDTESRSETYNLEKYKAYCEKINVIPVLAFVFYDEETNKIYLCILKVEEMETMAETDSNIDIIKEVERGIQFKYGRGYETLESYLNKYKESVDFTVIELNNRTFYS